MKHADPPADISVLLDEILIGASGDDEQLRALHQAFEDNLSLPADAYVIGEPVEVLEIGYDGNSRRGLTARCQRERGEHVIAAADVVFGEGADGARYIAAYRRWLGLVEPTVLTDAAPARGPRRHKLARETSTSAGPSSW